jgi:hypothetical protein
MTLILYATYNLAAISALILHFTGHLERWGMEWLLVLLAITVFPVVLYL